MATKIIIQCDICKKEIFDFGQYAKMNIRTYGDTRLSSYLPDIETTDDVCNSCLSELSELIIKLKDDKQNK